MKIYLAGGLFNAGERLHNLFLERELKALGYEVILPQRTALEFFDGEKFNTQGIVNDCSGQSANPQNIFVGSADGADADSGTAVEYGIAIASTGRAVVYRTDFRTEMSLELGMNAMLTAKGTRIIYLPCFFTELSEVDEYYRQLAGRIHEAIKEIL